jgi:hypothetical protein
VKKVDKLSSQGLVSLLAGKVSHESVISFKFNSRIYLFFMEFEPFNVCYALDLNNLFAVAQLFDAALELMMCVPLYAITFL